MNLETVVFLGQEIRLAVSTQREGDDSFRCSVFEVNGPENDTLSYRMISEGFEAGTCLEAQTNAYNYAKRVYPRFAEQMKKPPYLIGCGPTISL